MTLRVNYVHSSETKEIPDGPSLYAKLRMENGSFKTTRPQRFADIDPTIIEAIKAIPGPVRILDVGISTGVTTAEWSELLERSGIAFEMTATDLTLSGRERRWGNFFRVLEQKNGYPLRFTLLGLSMKNWLRRRDYLWMGFVCLWFLRAINRMMNKFFAARCASKDIYFVSPQLLQRKDVRLIEDDLFVRNPDFTNQFDFVRAANILNKAYFSDEQLAVGIANLKSYLRPGGLLLITRTTEEGFNKASLFLVDEAGEAHCVFSHNGGVEAAPMVASSP